MPTPLRRNRDFVALWVGQAVSSLGISISSFAYPLLVLEATGSAAQAGLVGTVLTATTFLLRLPAGALVDRWSRRAILICCDLGRAASSLALALVLLLGGFHLALVLAVALVEGALGVLFGPAERAAVRRVVAQEQIRDAVALNESRSALPGLVGPGLGGALYAARSAFPFVADAASYLVSLVCVLLVRAPLQETHGPDARGSWRSELVEGVRWIWSDRFLRALLLWFAGVGLVFGSLGLVLLVRVREAGASPAALGAMFTITAAGGAVGALAAPWLLRAVPARWLIVAFAWTAAAATLLLLGTRSPYASGALGALAFVLAPAVNALAFARVAERAPDRLQGRATSAAIQLTGVAAPAGPALAGALAAGLGSTATVAVYAAALCALAVAATTSQALRSAS
jgi:predicted MFS family arabinose efflux permease